MKVEVEGKEGFIENSFGDRAIIPKDKWGEVQKMIDEGCYDCIDRFVANLPKYSDYAATGSTIPSDQRSPSGGSEVPEDGKSVLEVVKNKKKNKQ